MYPRPLIVAVLLATSCHAIPETDIGDDAGSDAADDNTTPDARASDPATDDGPALPSNCRAILDGDVEAASGTYTIADSEGAPVDVECDMEGGWTQVVHVDVNEDPFCPPEWELSMEPTGCGRGDSADEIRIAQFEVPHAFREVRGRARGIQWRSTDAFGAGGGDVPVDGNFVDGITILREDGASFEHVWTFASAFAEESGMYSNLVCPCNGGREPPDFVGDHFFCESGWTGPDWSERWEVQDLLWDESDCTEAPHDWFEVDLGRESTGALQARLLLDSGPGDENLRITELELWIR